jgi:hypothetical protein
MAPVSSLDRVVGGVAVSFRNGVRLLLDESDPNFDVLLAHAEAGLRRSLAPVGFVAANDGRIRDLATAHETPVRSVRPFPNNPGLFEVAFWAYSPLCAISRDQFGFERIYTTLLEATKTRQMVYVAVHSSEEIEGETDEDGLAPSYQKVMDVRPLLCGGW